MYTTTRAVLFSIPANPMLMTLDTHIQVCLAKMHAGLSIGGLPLPQSLLPQGSGAPNIPPNGGLGSTPLITIEQPRYRYSYLVEKARQQAGFAQQLGASLLQALEKNDAEAYNRLLADNAVEVATATVDLKNLMVNEARRGKDVADQQFTRADTQQQFWDKRINSNNLGLSYKEMAGMSLMALSSGLQAGAAGIYGAMVLPAAIVGYAGVASAATGDPGGVMLFLGAAAAGGPMLAQSMQAAAGSAGTLGSLALTFASFERRWEDWGLQQQLANIDKTIAGMQVGMAQDRIDIASKDQQISNLQQLHAQQVVNFLKNKFSNVELYYWMIQLLTELYRGLMQIATATALAAQAALEFERQTPPTHPIVGDYWSIDLNTLGASDLSTQQKNSGLLSAERLLTAITQLDADKIATDRRRLEIAKTLSLARLIPTALLELKTSGQVTFNSLMDWFDWDFPGHYLRLIKSVKVTILALVPPIDGIHAMLSNGGESSVVVKQPDGSFVKQRAMRTFGEEIALDSLYNDTGLFVLDYNDPMFLPFEGLGVESLWTLELPIATNRFNFDTIVDVFFTIEYTAYYDKNYRAEVIQRLSNTASMDYMVDLRAAFPDEWYHFKNPTRDAHGIVQAAPLKFDLPRVLFPPHLADPLETYHLTLVVSGTLKERFEDVKNWITLEKLLPQPAGAKQVFTGDAAAPGRPATPTPPAPEIPGNRYLEGHAETDTYVLFSTRIDTQEVGQAPLDRSTLLTDVEPVGTWSIDVKPDIYGTLPVAPASVANPTPPLIDLIDDIMLIVTVAGEVRWPSISP